jgi:hypothetical protein
MNFRPHRYKRLPQRPVVKQINLGSSLNVTDHVADPPPPQKKTKARQHCDFPYLKLYVSEQQKIRQKTMDRKVQQSYFNFGAESKFVACSPQ